MEIEVDELSVRKAMTENEQKWYFTFCCDDKKSNNFVSFFGTYSEAREEMIRRFGMHWAFQYSEKDFEGQKEEYGLEELFL